MNLIGKTIGNYQIVEEIGRGGMGTVYRAYQPSLNRSVALKILIPNLAQDVEFFKRFRQEAIATAALDHPNIIHVYDTGEDQGVYYIAMEYVAGGNLFARMKNHAAPLPPAETVTIVAQIANALAFAHRNGIVHRDVKPSNILLDSEGRAVLSDLGIARALQEGTRLTQTGATIGTPDYMSPEQAQGKTLDGRSDLYSLGVVVYEMLTGKNPFSADTHVATLYKQVHESAPDPHKINSRIPNKLAAATLKSLAKEPAKRFSTGDQMANALLESVPNVRNRVSAPGATVLKMTPQQVAVTTLDTARDFGVRTLRGLGRFSLILLKRAIEGIVATAVLLVLISAILAIVFSFVIARYAQTTMSNYVWTFEDFGPSKPYVLTSSTFKRDATTFITNQTFGSISDAGIAFVRPNQVILSAKVLSNPVTLDAIVFASEGAPQIQLQHLNSFPLPLVDGIISNGINQGFREGWIKSPVRVKGIVVTETSLTMETEKK